MHKVRVVRQATFLDFRRYKKTEKNIKETGDGQVERIEIRQGSRKQDASEAGLLKKLTGDDKAATSVEQWNVDDIQSIVTAKNLCSCKDPISTAFKCCKVASEEVQSGIKSFRISRRRRKLESITLPKGNFSYLLLELMRKKLMVNCTLQTFADANVENTEVLTKLADQTEDFAVQLIDQVNANEQLVMQDVPERVDRCASMLSGMTDKAIFFSQKKFVAHPLLYKKLQMRWNLGIPKVLKPHGKFRPFLYLLILIDTILTPFLLPLIGYAFYRDQNKRRLRSSTAVQEQGETMLSSEEKPRLNILDYYLNYSTAPFVLFIKDKLSQVSFIALHCIICISDSTIRPRTEEYFIFIFFCGLILSEYQQYRRSPKYFKDMWNYVDVLTLFIYILIVLIRIVTVFRGGTAYKNDLLEGAHFLYGVNTMFLVLRFSSILELNSVVGPLQLALFRMFVDLLIILMQFGFVVAAFSLAITKIFKAQLSNLAPLSSTGNRTESARKLREHCEQGAFECLYETSAHLIWSVFGLTELGAMDPADGSSSMFSRGLYLIFLILTVIMLINMLVALLSKTYDNITTNAEVEWKFSRAVVENQYRNLHSIVVPFNLLSVPVALLYYSLKGNPREDEGKDRRKQYKNFYRDRLFPILTERYLKKYGGSFPLSVEDKIDSIMAKLNISHSEKENKPRSFEEVVTDNLSVPGNSQMQTSATRFVESTSNIEMSSSV